MSTQRAENVLVIPCRPEVAIVESGPHPAESALAAPGGATPEQQRMMATLAHELRNPVGCIKTAMQILRMLGGLDPRLSPTHDIIDRQVVQMTRMIENLLDAVRLSEGQIVARPEYMDLAQVVRNSVANCGRQFEDAGLHLTVSLPDEPVWIHADLSRIHQIVSNLLTNAAKFTERGGDLLISLENNEAADEVLLRVQDTGAGIDAELLSRLFTPFVQSERTRELSRGGMGLGLSVVRNLARLHGGDVQAFSAGEGKGSEFIVRLPHGGPFVRASPRTRALDDKPPAALVCQLLESPADGW